MAEVRNLIQKIYLVWFFWDRSPLEHALLAAALECYCLVTVFKLVADSHVISRQEPTSNPQVPRREYRFLRRIAPFISEVCVHILCKEAHNSSKHKKGTGKLLCRRIRYPAVVWMFKAADGPNRRVKEGGLGLWVALHLEEFSSWPQWLSMGQWVFFFRASDVWDTRWFHFSILVQRDSWVGPELQSAKRDSSKLNRLPVW